MKSLLLAVAALVPALAFSQIQYDTLSSFPAGPGMIHTVIHVPQVPWMINVLEIDLRNPYVKMETAKANDRLAGYERPSSMAIRKTYPGHTVVGAVNGDFYGGTGIPISIQVAQGEILRSPIDKSTIGFDAANKTMLRVVSMNITVRTTSASRTVNDVNATRNTDQFILYNRYMGATTGTNSFGAEALIRPIGEWVVNDTIRCVVDTVVNGVGNMSIPAGRAVLSGHGASQTWMVASLRARDTIKLYQRISPGIARLRELIGGFPKIVANGVDYVDEGYREENGPSHTYERHPRTGAGFTADSSRLFLITVDGRQTSSAGMTLHELAGFMLTRGIAWGVNFDGGGSTAMVIRGTVVNSPSDGGGERAVSNALLAVSTAPTDTLSRIIIGPRSRRIFRGETYRFLVRGVDRYGNPQALVPGTLRFSAPARLGTIDSTGLFTAAAQPDSGFVHVRYNQFRDSAYVLIKSVGRVVLTPEDVVTDTTRVVQFTARAFDIDGIEKPFPATLYTWRATNQAIGSIDSIGRFKGRSAGRTNIIAAFDNITDTASVRVELGTGRSIVDSLERLTGWSLSGRDIDTVASRLTLQPGIATLGANSFRIFYSFTANPSVLNFVQLNTSLPVFGVPDSIVLDVKADSSSHRLFYYVADDNGEEFKISSTRFVSVLNGFDTVKTRFLPVGTGTFNFPITIRKIEIQLGGSREMGQVNSGVILVDNLRVTYPSRVTSVLPEHGIPDAFLVMQNYPNPFNAATTISYQLPRASHVTLTVYNILGQRVTTLVDEVENAGYKALYWNAEGLASGVYFYSLQAGEYASVKRMILMK